MRETITPVTRETLVREVAKLKVDGYRLVTLSCTEIDAGALDLLYHFDKDLTLTHLRLAAAKRASVPSISPVYFAALLIENEIQDLFGLRFEGLVVDYQGTLYLEQEALKTPFCRFSLRQGQGPAAAADAIAADPGPAAAQTQPE
ncbi:MAG: NADH-quinone oxidoreductase subunit C [Desulfobacterales bacterium]|jgi:ech hydrogenase subunit D|nr:NADH-quinone oxidoreductase subunit C [Desulfobacterales bacterium]